MVARGKEGEGESGGKCLYIQTLYVHMNKRNFKKKTLNLATLLLVDPGHNCLKVMDEAFSSWPDITD
jgi:hypothetical protein